MHQIESSENYATKIKVQRTIYNKGKSSGVLLQKNNEQIVINFALISPKNNS